MDVYARFGYRFSMRIATYFKVHRHVARSIGRNDFDDAIRILEDALDGGASDVLNLELIAQCHDWAKRDEMAIVSAKRALDIDPKSFAALKLLSRIYARRADHDTAVLYIRRAMDQYPEPLPETPKFYFTLLRGAALIFPRLRAIAERAEDEIGNPNTDTEHWYAWAQQYLSWYDTIHNARTSPAIH